MNNFFGPNNSYNVFRTIISQKLNEIKDSNIKVGVALDVDVNGNRFFEGCPRNSIIFKLDDSSDLGETFLLEDINSVALPLQDYPIKSGESVFIVYFTSEQSQAFWIPVLNFPTKYNKGKITKSSEDRIFDEENENEETAIIEDDIPQFKCRMGDRVIEGTNNAMSYISRDRPNDGNSGHKEKAGLYYIVAGRYGEDIDLEKDMSYIYISQKTDVDDNLKDNENPKKEAASIILKTDSPRILFKDFRIYNKKVKCIIDEDGNIELKLLDGPKSKIKLDKNGNLTFENVKNINVKGASEIKLGQQGKNLVTFDELMAYTVQLENMIKSTTATVGTSPVNFIWGLPGGLKSNASTKTTKTKVSV